MNNLYGGYLVFVRKDSLRFCGEEVGFPSDTLILLEIMDLEFYVLP